MREREENNRPSSDPSAKHPHSTHAASQAVPLSSLPFFKQSPRPTILLIQLLLRLKEQRVFGLLLMLISRPFCMDRVTAVKGRANERASERMNRTSVVNAQNQMPFSLKVEQRSRVTCAPLSPQSNFYYLSAALLLLHLPTTSP